jgi:hypothetical protein
VSLIRTKLAAGAALAILAAVLAPLGSHSGGVAPFAAEAQNLGLRVVSGFVSDADAKPVVGATVFLKDLKSKNIRSFTSAEQGRFRFANTSMAEDHELWAEKDGKKSAVKSITSWDARKEIEVELRLK